MRQTTANNCETLSGNSASYSVGGIRSSQGQNQIVVEAYDKASNDSTLATVTVIYDTTPPTVSITNP